MNKPDPMAEDSLELNSPDNENKLDEIHQILDDFYDGVFIEELPKAIAAINAYTTNKIIDFAEKVKNDPVLKSNGITQEGNTLCQTIDRELKALNHRKDD